MGIEDLFYNIGLSVEKLYNGTKRTVKQALLPTPSEKPPSWISTRFIRQKEFTPHEAISLHTQLCFIVYLVLSFAVVFLTVNPWYVLTIFVLYFLYVRYIFRRYGEFLIDEKSYRAFYFYISVISFLAIFGYSILRDLSLTAYYYYAYIGLVTLVVLFFRYYFKSHYGRDYTYGVVEEAKNDLVRVFVHDDIAANVKPGRYWVPAVPDAEPGRIVKLLVEERSMRSSVPVRVLEVYLGDAGQSSQTETEPKDETE